MKKLILIFLLFNCFAFANIKDNRVDIVDSTGSIPSSQLESGIPSTKIGNGDVDNDTLSYIKNLSSDAQTQITNRIPYGQDITVTNDVTVGSGSQILKAGESKVTFNVPHQWAAVASDPTQNLTDGTTWYNTTSDEYKGRVNGVTRVFQTVAD